MLGKGGHFLCRGKQVLQLYILASMGMWAPVQIWLLPIGIGHHEDGESGVGRLVFKVRYGYGTIWLTATLETLKICSW